MARVLNATCKNLKVMVGDFEIENVEILGEGIEDSQGILIIDEISKYYIPQGKADIKEFISISSDVITTLITIINSIADGMTGSTTAPPPTLPDDILDLNDKIMMLNNLKDNLL